MIWTAYGVFRQQRQCKGDTGLDVMPFEIATHHIYMFFIFIHSKCAKAQPCPNVFTCYFLPPACSHFGSLVPFLFSLCGRLVVWLQGGKRGVNSGVHPPRSSVLSNDSPASGVCLCLCVCVCVCVLSPRGHTCTQSLTVCLAKQNRCQ